MGSVYAREPGAVAYRPVTREEIPMPVTTSTPSTPFPYASLFAGNPFAQSAQAQFEAAGEIARIGTDTMRQVMKQQQDLFLTMLERWQVSAGKTPKEPGALLGLPIEAARVGTEIALQNASELAEIARQAQADVVAVLTARTEQLASDTAHAVEESAKEAGKLVKKAAAKTAAETADVTAEQAALSAKLVE
jgi:hypothetical protein